MSASFALGVCIRPGSVFVAGSASSGWQEAPASIIFVHRLCVEGHHSFSYTPWAPQGVYGALEGGAVLSVVELGFQAFPLLVRESVADDHCGAEHVGYPDSQGVFGAALYFRWDDGLLEVGGSPDEFLVVHQGVVVRV